MWNLRNDRNERIYKNENTGTENKLAVIKGDGGVDIN